MTAVGPANAAEFGLDYVDHERGGVREVPHLRISGPIVSGDTEHLRQAVLKNRQDFLHTSGIDIDSPGGSVLEAMELGRLVRSLYLPLNVNEGQHCLSACFLVFVAAVDRHAAGPDKLGVHRAFFSPEAVSNLDLAVLDKEQRALRGQMRSYLDEMEVPAAIQDRMQAYASSEVLWLSPSEVWSIGMMASFWQEALVARCGLNVAAYKGLMTSHNDAEAAPYLERLDGFWDCNVALKRAEMQKTFDRLQVVHPAK